MSNKHAYACAALLAVFCCSTVQAGEVVAHRNDNLSGQMTGGWIALLLGGALGGPAGALAGGALGAWLGGEAQQAAGVSGDAYLIEMDDGEVRRFRSPNHQFAEGDVVDIEGIRPIPR